MSARASKVHSFSFPTYSEVRQLLVLWQGVAKDEVNDMINAIEGQRGTSQNPVDWSDPDTWIAERLSGKEQALAQRIWKGSDRTINPRHVYGSYRLIQLYDLLEPDTAGVYRLNERGRKFLDDDPEVVRDIDDAEGVPDLLAMLATKVHARRGDLIEEWGALLEQYSNYGTTSTIQATLRMRLLNLIDRGLAEREGTSYNITRAGLDYVETISTPTRETDKRSDVTKSVHEYNQAQLTRLREMLHEMPPYQFEELVGSLLEAMGYVDVTVTKESGDKGIDVVGKVQFGITEITEVVQVKRFKHNIQRPVLDQLRGSLPYHKALRGTIITTSDFSKGCAEAALFPGAQPITLINGDRLVELLLENDIGIRRRAITLYEIDVAAFEPPESLSDADEALD